MPGEGVLDVRTNRSTVPSGQPIGIVATVGNPDDERSAFTLELTMFGEVVSVREVAVPAESTREFRFVREIQAPGEYTANVDGVATQFVVVGDATPRTPDGDRASARVPLGNLLPVVAVAAALALAAWRRW